MSQALPCWGRNGVSCKGREKECESCETVKGADFNVKGWRLGGGVRDYGKLRL